MAIEVFELQATLGLDSGKFERGLSTAKKGFSALNNFAGVAVKAVGGVATALTAIGTASIRQASKFETAFAKVQTIMDKTAVSTAEFSQGIFDMSSNLGIASEDIADTVYNAISATGDTANALLLTERATKLAIAGFTDTNSALNVLTTAINAYGMSAEQAEHISDSLIQVQNLGVTTVGQLSTAMGRAIATGSAYGVSLENLESAYISLTKGGIATAESTTYLSSMMSELGKDSTDVAKTLKQQTGKSFSELMNMGYSLADVLNILLKSVDGNASAMMNLWSSQEAGKASNAIINQGLTTFNENLQTLKTSLGTTEDAFNTMADTLERKVAILKETGKNLLTQLGQGLEGAQLDLLTIASNQMELLSEAYAQGGALGMAKAGGTIIANLVNAIVDYAPTMIDTAMLVVTSFIEGLNENLDSMLIGAGNLMAKLIEGIVSAIPSLGDLAYNLVASLINYVDDAIVALFDNFPNFIAWLIKFNFKFLSNLLSLGMTLVSKIIEGLVTAVPQFLENLPDFVALIVESVKEGWGILKDTGKSIAEKIFEGYAAWFKMLGWAGAKILELTGWNEVLEGTEFGAKVEDYIKQYESRINSVADVSKNAFKDAESEIISVVDNIDESVSKLNTTATSGASALIDALTPIAMKDIKIKIDTSDAIGMLNTLRVNLEGLGYSSEEISELLSGSIDEITAKLQNLGITLEDVASKQSDFQDFLDTYQVTAQDFASTAMNLFDNLASSVAEVGGMLVEGTASWEDWGLMALQMVGETLIALGKQLATMALVELLKGNWAGFGMATAGSATALIAGGALSASAKKAQQAREEAREVSQWTTSDVSTSTGTGGTTIIQNIQSVPQTAYELEQQAYAMASKLRWA